MAEMSAVVNGRPARMRSCGMSETCSESGPVMSPTSAHPNSCRVNKFSASDCCSNPTNVKSLTMGGLFHAPRRQSFVSVVLKKSLATSPAQPSAESRRSNVQLSVEAVAQAAGSERPKSASKVGHSTSGAGGQLVPVKFWVVFALRLLRFETPGENETHAPATSSEYEPGFTAKL